MLRWYWRRGVAPTFTIENCERRSQNRQNKLEFYSSYHFLTIYFLLFKLASHPRSLLPWMTRSECIFKNFQNQIVNALHKFSAFCERRSQNCERRSQLWTWAPRSRIFDWSELEVLVNSIFFWIRKLWVLRIQNL